MKKHSTPSDTVRLNIRRGFLDQIVSGEKKEEIRDASDYNSKLFCLVDENKNAIGIKPYKKAYFYVERNKEPKFAEVEIEKIIIEEYLDDDTGDDTGKYYFELVLGKVLNHNLN